jgi:hypothetical protein
MDMASPSDPVTLNDWIIKYTFANGYGFAQ